MSNLISHVFNDTNVRAIDRDGEIWFVAADVCKALEINNVTKALYSLDDDEKMTLTNSKGRAGQGAQSYNIINESGLYSLVLRSRKPEAKRFKKWVTSEVLPSIRKTGSYSLTINTQQQHEIKEAVHQNVSRTGRTFQAVYHDLYNRFQIPKYQDLLAKDFDAAIEYLGCSDKPAIPLFSNMTTNGRWLVVVNNNVVTCVKSLANYNCVNVEAFKKLIFQTKQQSEYLLELAKRMRIIEGECLESRLDTPIEELHPRFII